MRAAECANGSRDDAERGVLDEFALSEFDVACVETPSNLPKFTVGLQDFERKNRYRQF